MDVCIFCKAFAGINWWWYAVATILSFLVGGVWYSALFSKAWIRIFKVEMGEVTAASMVRTFSLQIAATLFLGLVFFVLTNISAGLAVFTLIGIVGWEKAMLNFQFSNIKDFLMAVVIRAGYTLVAGIIFILFALL